MVDALLGAQIAEELYDAARHVADDNACDEQGEGIAQYLREGQQQCHDQQRSSHGSHDDQQIAACR